MEGSLFIWKWKRQDVKLAWFAYSGECRQHFSSKHKTGCFLASFKTSWLMLCCSSKKVAAAYMIAPDWTPKEKGKSPHSSECHSCCGSLFITLQMGERKVTELRNILHKKRKYWEVNTSQSSNWWRFERPSNLHQQLETKQLVNYSQQKCMW